jgi:hypothetical protein
VPLSTAVRYNGELPGTADDSWIGAGRWPQYTQISPGLTERPWDEVCKPSPPPPSGTVRRGGMAATLVDGLAPTMPGLSHTCAAAAILRSYWPAPRLHSALSLAKHLTVLKI